MVIGPGHSGDTLRLQRFLSRNGYPHRVLDTETDPDAGGFLDCFELTPDQLPGRDRTAASGCCAIRRPRRSPTISA